VGGGLRRLLRAVASRGLSVVYGEYAAGKTTLALLVARMLCSGSACLYVTTEGTEFLERAVQVGAPIDAMDVFDVVDVYDYASLVAALSRRPPYRLVIVDSVNAPVRRAEEPGSAELYMLTVAFMKSYCERSGSTAVLTAQVTGEDERPAYWPPLLMYADRIVRLDKLGTGLRRALLLPAGLTACFRLTGRGFAETPCP